MAEEGVGAVAAGDSYGRAAAVGVLALTAFS